MERAGGLLHKDGAEGKSNCKEHGVVGEGVDPMFRVEQENEANTGKSSSAHRYYSLDEALSSEILGSKCQSISSRP